MKKELNITLRDWDYTCGDGCCYMAVTELYLNGEKCEDVYAGDSVTKALEFVLGKLGYTKVEITEE